MSGKRQTRDTLRMLGYARQLAEHAEAVGLTEAAVVRRAELHHIGAVIADSILQAGVKYQTVVRPRVDRIIKCFPETSIISGVFDIIAVDGVSDYLLWNDPKKIERFIRLAQFLKGQKIEDTFDLSDWLKCEVRRSQLLLLHGVGPKTVDYMCCLVGVDSVAVDRHVRRFASAAGIQFRAYDELRLVVSFAADLLGLPRRDFDARIWSLMASQRVDDQLRLL